MARRTSLATTSVTIPDILRNLKKDARDPDKSRAAVQSLAAMRAAVQLTAQLGNEYGLDDILTGSEIQTAHKRKVETLKITTEQLLARHQALTQPQPPNPEEN